MNTEKKGMTSTPLKGPCEWLGRWVTQRHGSQRGEVRRAATDASAPTNTQINKTPGAHISHQQCMKVAKTRPNPLTAVGPESERDVSRAHFRDGVGRHSEPSEHLGNDLGYNRTDLVESVEKT